MALHKGVRYAHSVVLAAALAAGSCAGPTRTFHDQNDEDDVESYRSEATIHSSRGGADIELGRSAAMHGDYPKAIEIFLDVYQSSSAEPEQKAQALLALGDIHRNPLNPRHDDATALSYYTKLIEEFPASELRSKAEQGVRETSAAAAPDTTAPR